MQLRAKEYLSTQADNKSLHQGGSKRGGGKERETSSGQDVARGSTPAEPRAQVQRKTEKKNKQRRNQSKTSKTSNQHNKRQRGTKQGTGKIKPRRANKQHNKKRSKEKAKTNHTTQSQTRTNNTKQGEIKQNTAHNSNKTQPAWREWGSKSPTTSKGEGSVRPKTARRDGERQAN